MSIIHWFLHGKWLLILFNDFFKTSILQPAFTSASHFMLQCPLEIPSLTNKCTRLHVLIYIYTYIYKPQDILTASGCQNELTLGVALWNKMLIYTMELICVNWRRGNETPVSNIWTCMTGNDSNCPEKIHFLHKAADFTVQKMAWSNKKT